jgi:hypothetical protein
VQGLLRVTWLEYVRDCKGDVKGDVRGSTHEDYGENVKGLITCRLTRKKRRWLAENKTHNQRGWCSIFNDLSCHESITKKRPEKGRDSTCMNGRNDDKGGGSLLKKGACCDELKGEGDKVKGEECTKFDTTWSWVWKS